MARWGLAFAVMLALLVPLPARAQSHVLVITNPQTPATELSEAMLRGIYMMRVRQWPGDGPIRVFVLPDRDGLHRTFSRDFLRTYPYVLRDAWDRLVFTGTGQAPIEVATEEELVRRVARTPGAIGYIHGEKAALNGVKVLSVR